VQWKDILMEKGQGIEKCFSQFRIPGGREFTTAFRTTLGYTQTSGQYVLALFPGDKVVEMCA
jgi:hypothetical protein